MSEEQKYPKSRQELGNKPEYFQIHSSVISLVSSVVSCVIDDFKTSPNQTSLHGWSWFKKTSENLSFLKIITYFQVFPFNLLFLKKLINIYHLGLALPGSRQESSQVLVKLHTLEFHNKSMTGIAKNSCSRRRPTVPPKLRKKDLCMFLNGGLAIFKRFENSWNLGIIPKNLNLRNIKKYIL